MELNDFSIEMIAVVAVLILLAILILYWLFKKAFKASAKSSMAEEADLLMTALPRAMSEKKLEDPLLAASNNSAQANNRLHIAAVYLVTCLTAIRKANGNVKYIDSKAFEGLLREVLPKLKQLYLERGTKNERIGELITLNFKKIRMVVGNYCKDSKVADIDATSAIQVWFEDLSYINLANKPYLTDTLLKLTKNEKEQQFIKTLCQPKPYSFLLDQVRDNTESFIRTTQAISSQSLQQNNQLISHSYFEQYTMAFLLLLGITVIKQAKGDVHYLQGSEYQALKSKAVSAIRNMLLNSRKVGVQSLDQTHTKNIITLMEQQLGVLQMICLNYLKAIATNKEASVDYLFNWYKQSLPNNVNASSMIKDYIKKELTN